MTSQIASRDRARIVFNQFSQDCIGRDSGDEQVTIVDQIAALQFQSGLETVGSFGGQPARPILACWFQVGDCAEVAIVTPGNPNDNGSFKRTFFGRMSQSTAAKVDRVFKVALLKTNQRELRPGKIDWFQNEYRVLTGAVSSPIPGLVPVIAVNKDATDDGFTQNFTAVFPKFTGDLYTVLSSPDVLRGMSSEVKYSLQIKFLEALAKFHGAGWIHRDIKLENVLVLLSSPEGTSLELSLPVLNDPKTNIQVCLTDVGFSIFRNDNLSFEEVPGSFLYLSPEIAFYCLEGKANGLFQITPTQADDAWACGLVLLSLQDVLLYKKVINTKGKTLQEIAQNNLNNYLSYYREAKISCFPEPEDQNSMLHIIWELLNPIPGRRLSVNHALQKVEMLEMLTTQFQFVAS